LRASVVEIQKLESGPRTKLKSCTRYMNFRAGSIIGKQLVADRERTVHRGRNPVIHTAWLKGN
jgi:hypothetical protein